MTEGFSKVSLSVPLSYPFVYGVIEIPPTEVDVLSQFDEYNRNPRVLADCHPLLPGDGRILLQLPQYLDSRR